mmetsp:Transcript_15872/g.46294  ORF Transcript_15872/g.46294 Transcript_15872/m.46294 type:complete len:223 (-) Transcript_15872:341-1009(-)
MDRRGTGAVRIPPRSGDLGLAGDQRAAWGETAALAEVPGDPLHPARLGGWGVPRPVGPLTTPMPAAALRCDAEASCSTRVDTGLLSRMISTFVPTTARPRAAASRMPKAPRSPNKLSLTSSFSRERLSAMPRCSASPRASPSSQRRRLRTVSAHVGAARQSLSASMPSTPMRALPSRTTVRKLRVCGAATTNMAMSRTPLSASRLSQRVRRVMSARRESDSM